MSELNFPWKTGTKYVTGGDFVPSDLKPSTTLSLYKSVANPVIDVFVDTSECTTMTDMFEDADMYTIKLFDTSECTTMADMFYGCVNLVTIPRFDTSNVTSMSRLLYNCTHLYDLPMLDTSNVTNMNGLLYSTMITSFPQWDMSKVVNVTDMFYGCKCLIDVPELDWSSVTSCGSPFGSNSLSSVCNLGGFKDLGKEKSISGTTSYFLNVLPNLTHESLMNVINKLYDRKTAGYSTLSLKFGSTNLGKLSDEEKAIATNKGYTLTS